GRIDLECDLQAFAIMVERCIERALLVVDRANVDLDARERVSIADLRHGKRSALAFPGGGVQIAFLCQDNAKIILDAGYFAYIASRFSAGKRKRKEAWEFAAARLTDGVMEP